MSPLFLMDHTDQIFWEESRDGESLCKWSLSCLLIMSLLLRAGGITGSELQIIPKRNVTK